MTSPHISVMVQEVLYWLYPEEGNIYVDCTVGGGGHSKAILEKLKGKVKILGIDRDEEALKIARAELKRHARQIILRKGNFRDLSVILAEEGIEKVDGVLYDLGLSTIQLDNPGRGFSFRYDAPLDMRVDRGQFLTAAHLVKQLSAEELGDIFFRLGQERWAKRVAEFVVRERRVHPIETTSDLVKVIEKAIPARVRTRRKIHFATKIFQALRIQVNRELENIRESLICCFNLVRRKGRICVISYHSLEDKIVKEEFRKRNGDGINILTKKVIKPSQEEIRKNPRARSAKLRSAEIR